MTLYDLLSTGQYMQTYSIYVTNIYNQNIPIARGTLSDMLKYEAEEGEGEFFMHLKDT